MNSQCKTQSMEMSTGNLDPRMHASLALLSGAYQCAGDLQQDVWDFAVELDCFRAVGGTHSDVRWLIAKGFVEHAFEMTLPGEENRTFRRIGKLMLTDRTCLVLTEAGAEFASRVCREMNQSAQPMNHANKTQPGLITPPTWDPDRHELRWNGHLVKCYRVHAPNQETILAVFEEENWPPRIDDPLPPHPEQNPKRRLHDTINSLNRRQKFPVLHFMGDGSGQGVRWEVNLDALRESSRSDNQASSIESSASVSGT